MSLRKVSRFPVQEVRRVLAVSLSYRQKGFLVPGKGNYCILLLLVPFFAFCTSAFGVISIFWVSPIMRRNAAYSHPGFSAVLIKRILLSLILSVLVKTDFPTQLLLHIPIAKVNFWLGFSLFYVLPPFWSLFSTFVTSALIFPGAGV